MTDQIDNLFPELNRDILSAHAGRWAKKEKYNGHIVNISIHPYIDRLDPYCYAVVFHLDFNHPGIHREESKETEIEKEIVWDEMEFTRHTSFKKVYKDPPTEGYEEEWFFYPKYQDEAMPPNIGEALWQLYPKADEQSQARILDEAAIIVLSEARKLRTNKPKMNKVQAKETIDSILIKKGYAPYSRSQFNRIIKSLGFPPATRGRKLSKTNS